MKIKELKNYTGKIFVYCANKDSIINMLEALDQDLGIDQYQDTQPGGGNCVFNNRSQYKEYEDKLEELTSEKVFGTLYHNLNKGEQRLLDALLKECYGKYEIKYFVEVTEVYQMCKFLNIVCDLEFADKTFTADDITLISEAGHYFAKMARKSYDEKTDSIKFELSVKHVKRFLKKRYRKMMRKRAS